jgi:hypothetical protein
MRRSFTPWLGRPLQPGVRNISQSFIDIAHLQQVSFCDGFPSGGRFSQKLKQTTCN